MASALRFPLLISDIDGTLVLNGTRPDAHILEGVKQAIARGLRFTLASGRNKLELLWYMDAIGLDEPYIALGGAYVGVPGQEKAVYDERLPLDAARFVLETARDAGLDIVIEYPDRLIYELKTPFMEEMDRLWSPILRFEPGAFQLDESPGKFVLIGSEERIQQVREKLDARPDKLEHSCSRSNVLDITARGVHKGRALRELANYIRLPLDKIAAIGDGGNDESLLIAAGLAIAMGGSDPSLLGIADLVAPTLEEDGLLWALNKLLNLNNPHNLSTV